MSAPCWDFQKFFWEISAIKAYREISIGVAANFWPIRIKTLDVSRKWILLNLFLLNDPMLLNRAQKSRKKCQIKKNGVIHNIFINKNKLRY